MKIAYNPITSPALVSAPNNSNITFDLPAANIYVKGVRFKGTDTTYSVFKKHNSNGTGGYNGLVPAPSYTTNNLRCLREDGVWAIPAQASSTLYTQLTNEDLNNYYSEGKWYWAAGNNTVVNRPTGIDAFELYVGRNAEGYRYQKLITAEGRVWFRYRTTSEWKSWVRWYTDMNTDQKVLQSVTTTSNFRPVVLGYSNSTSVSSLTQSITQQVYTTASIYVQPSTGGLWASKLYSGGKLVLTEHQSLANYVTLNTAQNITGAKTFSNSCLLVRGGANYITSLISTNTSIDVALRDNKWRIYHSNGTGTDRGLSIWSYGNNINNQVLSISAYNIGSTLASPGTAVNSLYMHGLIRATSTVTGSGFIKLDSSDAYVLLGGGGHKALSTIISEYDGRFVNVTGDTMTGKLNISMNSSSSQALSLLNTTAGWTYMTMGNGTSGAGAVHLAWNTTASGAIPANAYHIRPGGSVSIAGFTSSAIYLAQRLVIDSSGRCYPISTETRRAGMYGTYDSTKIGHIWSMGTNYMISDSGVNFGNIYGLAYKHTNNSTGGTMAGGHQAVWCANGRPKAALGESGVWADGGFYKTGSSNDYLLLGGGGHKLISDFMLKTDELANNLTTITKSLNVTQAWMDTGISSTALPANGTYVVQVYVKANDGTGIMYHCYLSGIMSWYKDPTNDTETDEIILHRSGHNYGKTIYLRTVMQSSGVLKLQIGANTNIGATYTYTFKFKRII